MKIRHHLLFSNISLIAWTGFYVAGLPFNYFQDFGLIPSLLLTFATLFGFLPFLCIIVLSFVKLPFMRAAIWLAFYGSLIPFVLDLFFVGIVKGEGMHFLISHWILTVGYIAVWILFPLTAKTLEKLSLKIINQEF